MKALSINNCEIGIKEFRNQRVVTFKDIDLVHERPKGTASRNFRKNRKHFIDSEDYFLVKPSDIQNDEIRRSEINTRGTTLLTETGYLMLVKSLTDDLAWNVQRELVKRYFRQAPKTDDNLKKKLLSSNANVDEVYLLLEVARRIDDKYWQQYIYRRLAKDMLDFTDEDVYPSKLLAFAQAYQTMPESERATYRTRMLSAMSGNQKAYNGALEFFKQIDSI
ncbi:MAG: hypothetical protein CVU99_03460 [Firmicutes bacterium HGW-Firmicutes-4]|nr:MAG: hypothetical protein CVU99_03460 [Firmicutes bacterium HGW-Firmicutes-4]